MLCSASSASGWAFQEKVAQYQGACDVDPTYREYLGTPELAAETLMGKPSLPRLLRQTYYEPLLFLITASFLVAPKISFIPLLAVLMLGYMREGLRR